MFKNVFTALVVCTLVGVLAGCARGSGSCCNAPDPCEPCAAPCDPCAGGGGRPAGMPPEAKQGEAWCRVLIPARYEDVERQVCTCPASCSREWIPPVYKDEERQVCCQPASCKTITIPAEYETKTEKVMTCPARTVWKKIPCEPGQLGEGEKQGDCWQLSEVPAQYKDVCTKVCTKEASCTKETIPPKYKTVTEKVLVTPGEWKTTPVEAKYKTVSDRKLVEPCRWEWRRNSDCEVPESAGSDGAAAADATEDVIRDEIVEDVDEIEDQDEIEDLGAPPAGSVEK